MGAYPDPTAPFNGLAFAAFLVLVGVLAYYGLRPSITRRRKDRR